MLTQEDPTTAIMDLLAVLPAHLTIDGMKVDRVVQFAIRNNSDVEGKT